MSDYCKKHHYPLNVFGGCLKCDAEDIPEQDNRVEQPKCKTCGGKGKINVPNFYCPKVIPCPICAVQPTDAPSVAPEAERPFIRPAVPPNRQAWDKMAKSTESSKITQDAREHVDNLFNREANLVRELCKYIDELVAKEQK